jgi:hypothetical protein
MICVTIDAKTSKELGWKPGYFWTRVGKHELVFGQCGWITLLLENMQLITSVHELTQIDPDFTKGYQWGFVLNLEIKWGVAFFFTYV